MTKQPTDIEIEILKSRIDSLECQMRFVNSNWIEWTNSTKNMGQKIIVKLDQLVNDKETPSQG